MKLLSRNYWALPLFLAVSISAANASADVVVVVSARSAIMHLTAEQVAKIFLGKTDTFPNGGKAVPVDHVEGSAIREEFYSKVANKDSAQITAYWARVIFTGDGRPPRQMEGNTSVRRTVAENPDTIGYIDKSAVDGSVRVILAP